MPFLPLDDTAPARTRTDRSRPDRDTPDRAERPRADGPASLSRRELTEAFRTRRREAADRSAAAAREAAERSRLDGIRKRLDELHAALGELPALEPDPDPRWEALAQGSAVVAFSTLAQVAVQTLLTDVDPLARGGALLGGSALGLGLGAAAWNTHVSRRSPWLFIGLGWLGTWAGALYMRLGRAGIADALAFGVNPRLLVSLLCTVGATVAALAIAHHVSALARRHRHNVDVERRRASLARQLETTERELPAPERVLPLAQPRPLPFPVE
jgi:hypothetical protein